MLCIMAFAIGKHAATSTPRSFISTSSEKDYPLLSKQIFIEGTDEHIINFSNLRKDLNTYFEDNKLSGTAYFEYLPTGTSIRISGEETEVAASLIKVPAAMDLYRAAELGKIDLDKKIALKQEWLDSGFGELYKKGAGYQISLREAAEIMLRDSDNTALKAVANSNNNLLSSDERVFNAVDVSITQNSDLSISISARSYSSILKCLYYACHLNKKDSQEILNYLTQTKFDDRLVAGIDDKNIRVAHKIGVFAETTQSDCGIVYIPNKNYVLCIMIDGANNDEVAKHIAEMSKKTFQFVYQQTTLKR